MAALDLEEQEQMSALRAWWEQYGNVVTTGLVVAAVAAVGFRGWGWYQDNQAVEASGLFHQVSKAAEAGNAQKAREATGLLFEKYAGTGYADLSGLVSGRAQIEAGDLKNAQAQLQRVADQGNDPLLRDLARLRLAAVQFDDKALDQALKTLEAAPAPVFAVRFADLKGDILLAQDKPAEARKAYQAALEAIKASGEASPLKDVVTAKLEALGGAQ